MTIFPFSWFGESEAESDPVHTVVCEACNRNPQDAELAVVEVDVDERSVYGGQCWDPETVRYYQLRETGKSYGPVVAVTQRDHGYETEVCRAAR